MQRRKQLKQTAPKRHSFRKLAGILIEPVLVDNKITGVIVGVGINIETAPVLCDDAQEDMGYQAVSLTQLIDETAQAYMVNDKKAQTRPPISSWLST